VDLDRSEDLCGLVGEISCAIYNMGDGGGVRVLCLTVQE